MTRSVLTVAEDQTWLEIPALQVTDLRRDGVARGGPERLRRALGNGLAAEPDPNRSNFYEAEVDGLRYYFWVASPDKVYLLAAWQA